MKSIYIPSFEANAIMKHEKGNHIELNYVGMVADSQLSSKLVKENIKIVDSKRYNKRLSADIVNVKFKQRFKGSKETAEDIDTNKIAEEILELESELEAETRKSYIRKIRYLIGKKKSYKTFIENALAEQWDGKSGPELRKMFYSKGFDINGTHYVFLGRTGSKARVGSVLFVNAKYSDSIKKYSRLGMRLDGRNDIDLPALLAAESLIASGIEDRITINVDNMLIVDDVKSVFSIDTNVIELNEKTGLLESNRRNDYKMTNDIFDGQGLLDSMYFLNNGMIDKGMVLVRQHHMKSCLFNANLQAYYRNHAKQNGIDYNTWEVCNMFGQKMKVKDIHCVITPNSLKALKLSHVKHSKKVMWETWKEYVKKDGCIFGVVKKDKESKKGRDENGYILNQTSYQMINTMPFDQEDIKNLASFELNYIDRLKNNDDEYIRYLEKNACDINSNAMLADIYRKNKNISKTDIFMNKRKKDIYNYVKHVKRGKIRLQGDYCTILGNPIEFLMHSIGALKIDKNNTIDVAAWQKLDTLKDNEVFTTLHQHGKEYTAFRNPHTSPSNVLIIKNITNQMIKKYINVTKNIICVNAVNFPIQRILSGADYDSDTLIMYSNDTMLLKARQCYVKSKESKYRVCANNVKQQKNIYTVTDDDIAKIDNILERSQKYIGSVVNLGMLYMSEYWDRLNKGNNEGLDELLKGVDICTILSEIAIDSAKRLYSVDIDRQIKHLRSSELLQVEKPLFFEGVSMNSKLKTKKYECSMDYLTKELENIKEAKAEKHIDIKRLLVNGDTRHIKKDRAVVILDILKQASDKEKKAKRDYEMKIKTNGKLPYTEGEKVAEITNIRNDAVYALKNKKIDKETMLYIVEKLFENTGNKKQKNRYSSMNLYVMNALYNNKAAKAVGLLEIIKAQ